jgi:hypothetical protein
MGDEVRTGADATGADEVVLNAIGAETRTGADNAA